MDIYWIWKVCAQGDLERPLALSGMSYKWLSHRGVHPSSGPIIQSPKEDSFLASFTESLNILSRMSRFSVRYSIRWSVQHSLRSHWIFGGHGSSLASGLTASVLEAQEQCLWGGAEVSSGSFHLGGMEQVTETETEVVKWLWWDGVWKDSRNGERGGRERGTEQWEDRKNCTVGDHRLTTW